MTSESPFQPSSPTGVMTAAVPQPNTSRSVAAPVGRSRSPPSRCERSLTSKPHSRSSVMTESRVTPPRMRALQRRGDELVADAHDQVHGADLFQVAVLGGVGPQHLRVAALLGLLGGQQAGGVVGARLDRAQAARRGAHVACPRPRCVTGLERLAASRRRPARRSRRTGSASTGRTPRNGSVAISVGRMYSDVPGDDGTQSRSTRTRASDRLAHQLDVDRRACTGARRPRACGGSGGRARNSAHLAVGAAEGLEPVEHRLAVVQHRRGRIQRQRAVGDDARVVPAASVLVVDRWPCGR